MTKSDEREMSEKRVCLVTGAGGLLGQALCQSLLPDYHVVATYRRTPPAVDSQLSWSFAVGEGSRISRPKQTNVYCVQADLTRREDVQRLAEVAIARFGGIDTVVNAAADTRFYGRLTELWDADDYASPQLLANCVAPLQLVSAIHQMCWKDAGAANADRNRAVVNVSSISALSVTQDRGQAFYAASKAALNVLTMYLAMDLAPYSVRANALCPSRFTEKENVLARVVRSIRGLLEGDATGEVVSEGATDE